MSLDAVAQGLRDAINRAILTLERVNAILIDAQAKFAVLQPKKPEVGLTKLEARKLKEKKRQYPLLHYMKYHYLFIRILPCCIFILAIALTSNYLMTEIQHDNFHWTWTSTIEVRRYVDI